ncbi:dimethylamine monooxygenase subunit DmmA family protein [Pseudomonas citronellolis]|uniref:dimethylamine monooxygenase subunit DmmA family protein n=1 Tax=Pseudomonas citronellolis TaxID=53408 RepID=UPI0023E4665A|nr:dimethylamine monooxygenase subunit DmmA family protein [Pseudomonas citronellolis]MDF3933116.1 dimethylamine monooxygenase subunit DmmA family protein [Pseudomonas citronellolis]
MTDSASAPPLPSLPRYDAPPRLAGGQPLLVAQVADAALTSELAERLGVAVQTLEVLDAAAHPGPAALQRALLERLGRASVGLQLYLSGDEAFLWPLHALARNAGLAADEIHLLRHGEGRRAVYCVHCASLQAGGTGDVHDCQRCGVRLEVRRHFSRRLGAYLGVCADADRPYAEGRA